VADGLSSSPAQGKEPDEISPEVTSRQEKQAEVLPPKRAAYIGDNREARQSARQLAKQAHSLSSLHTRKSKHGRSGRGEGRSDSVGRRGQPDMKLRMNAILAKIKQNYV
jgi:hypothetical protein